MLFLSEIQMLYAQDYSWKTYSVADGLPQTQVVTLMQDSDGLIWLGTKNGFSLFDGFEFENYSSKDGLDFDHIYSFQEYPKGVFYISTTTGLSLLKDGKITPIIRDLPIGYTIRLVDADVRLWYTDKDGFLQIWEEGGFHTRHEVFSLVTEGEKFIDVLPDTENRATWFYTSLGNLYERRGQQYAKVAKSAPGLHILKGQDGGLYAHNQYTLYHLGTDGFFLLYEAIQPIWPKLIKSPDDFYFTNYGVGNELYHFRHGRVEKFRHRFNLLSAVLEDDEGNLWLGTDSGLLRLMSNGFRNYLDDPEENFYSWTVLQDRNGDYLFGSYQQKMKKLQGDRFQDIPLPLSDEGGLYSIYSGGIRTDSGDLLISTANGVLKYDGVNLNWFFRPKRNTSVLYIYDDQRHDKYLLATSVEGLVETDNAGNANVYNDRGSFEHTELVTCVLRDKYDRIWISGKKGVSIRENDRWRNLPDEKDSIPIGAISMLMDSAQNIWLGSNDGLYHYNYKTLRKIAPETFDRQIGLVNITNDNRLLVGTINGMGLLDLEQFYKSDTTVLQFYNQHNGFLGVECKHNSSFKDKNGHIWLCTSDRVVKVLPEALQKNTTPPRVYVRSCSANGLTHTMNHSDTLPCVFAHDERNLRLSYRAISHAAPHLVRYRTKLDGYDSDWSDETAERYRSYTNLPHGQYTFMVMARNGDGVWAADPATATFRILPAWHEKMWVKISGIAVAMAFMVAIGYLFSERRRRLKVKEEMAERNIAKLQFKSLKGMIDPHFTFNAINAIASMVYSQNRDEAYGYFTKFSRLIRIVFEHSERTTRTLEEEIEFVKNYLDIERMRFSNSFRYEISIAPEINMDRLVPKLIVQIFVENAVKHGLRARKQDGLLEIIMKEENAALHIIIRDNGMGRGRANATVHEEKGLGRGTAIIRDYFDLLNKFNDRKIAFDTTDLLDADGAAAGTEVRISIPHDFKYAL